MDQALESFCTQNGIQRPFELTPIRSGRNSAVFRVSSKKNHWILKHYFQHDADKRNRLLVECQFLTFLNGVGCQFVATSVGYDAENQFALHSFLRGEKPSVIRDSYIDQAAQFILFLHGLKNHRKAKIIGNAVDACFSIEQHLNLVDKRFSQFDRIVGTDSSKLTEFLYWIKNILHPCWLKIQSDISINQKDFSKQSFTLSPSDFGFHNTLVHNGRLSFIDFEYAGWDSIAKLACDFICQPELPISRSQAAKFVAKLAQETNDSALTAQVNMLLPIHRIKWCCILLNVFRDIDRQRRVHSGVDFPDLLGKQLNEAKSYFEAHLQYLYKEK